ncbi:ATP-binding protein [Candidatus Woesearchaeota archaeon]|nr:ATP-binding protein [Candidatus Woesearchaeota archaeon]
MIIQFKDRDKELKEIKEVLDSNRFEFLILYGRRRIGKTELVLNATKHRRRVYYLATGEKNLERFYNSCLKYDHNISKLKKDWEILFEHLKDKAEVIIIDEFQNLIKEDKNILHLFQSIVDTIFKSSKLKLILLGSSVSIISSKVLSYQSPLYGRRTGSINLKPVSFFELNKFFPDKDINELVDIYGFADGIPFYLVRIEKEFWSWIKEEIVKERSFLRDEVDFLMKYEFEDAGTYKLILEAISNGCNKLNEMKNFIKVERTDISPYLRNLIDVGFVERKVSITENVKSRNGRYYLCDNFLNFWFRYFYPNLSSLEEGIFDVNFIRKDYSSYLGLVFEKISMDFFIRKNIFKFDKIGKWWHKDKEIDIVALNNNEGKVFYAECKWKERVDALKVLNGLKEKAKYVKWNRKKEEHYCIIAKSFKEKIKEKNLLLFDLEDIKR